MLKLIKSSFQICCLIWFLALSLTSCKQHQKNEVNKKEKSETAKPAVSNPEDEVVNLVMNLDEVKHKTAEVKKLSKGKRSLVTYVETPPTEKDHNYWVKVAEDNGDSLVPYYTFAVDSKSHRISWYDDIHDSMIPLDEWRKTTPAEDR